MALTLLLSGVASAGQGQGSSIVLRGKGSGYVDLTFPTAVTLDPERISASTDGSFAGFLVTGRTPGGKVTLLVGSVVVPEFDRLAPGLGPIAFAGQRLKAGTYRLHLVSDGRARVEIPAEGLPRPLDVEARLPSDASGRVDELQPPPGMAEVRVPIRRKLDTITIMGLLASVEHHQGSTAESCLLKEEDAVCDSMQVGTSRGFVVSPGSVGAGWVFYFNGIRERSVDPGNYVAYQSIVDAAASADHVAFTLNAHLTAPGQKPAKIRPTPPRTETFGYQFGAVDGVPVCGVLLPTGSEVGSCWGFASKYPERFLTLTTEDAAGGPVAGRVQWRDGGFEFCGQTEGPKRIPFEELIGVIVYAHPTAWCSLGHATTGTIEVTFHSTRPN